MDAQREAIGTRRPRIYEEAVAELKSQLGEETLNNVGAWVFLHEIGRTHRMKPKPPKSEGNTDSEQSPAVPQ
jgi:hypothetical protein